MLTRVPEPQTPNLQSSRLEPQLRILRRMKVVRLLRLIPKPSYTVNPKPYTLNSETITLYPKA